MRHVVLALCSWLLVGICPVTAQTPNVPVDPVDAVLQAFETHDLVGLPEGHGNERGHAFRLALIRDPRFAETVDDIVVEFGNVRYQDVIDRFVVGEEVPSDELRQVWQDTTVSNTMWDRPIIEEFYRAVRTINADLRPEHKLRVLLGDPPIDWDGIRNAADHREWTADMARDRFPARVIQQEVLAKGRRALIHYGWGHLQRRKPTRQAGIHSIVGYLEAATDASIFNIWPDYGTLSPGLAALQPDVVSWRIPRLTLLGGTVAGATRWRHFAPIPVSKQANDPLGDVKMQEQFDAALYFGPGAEQTSSQLAPSLCRDAEYIEMRLHRIALTSGMRPTDTPPAAEELTTYCAMVEP
jgi:hypothetical protein